MPVEFAAANLLCIRMTQFLALLSTPTDDSTRYLVQDAITRHGRFLVYKRAGERAVINYRGELLVRPGPLEVHVQLSMLGVLLRRGMPV